MPRRSVSKTTLRSFICEILLVEGRFSDLLERSLEDETLQDFWDKIPSVAAAIKNEVGENVGYLEFALKQLRAARGTEASVMDQEVVLLIKDFHSVRNGLTQKDINRYPSIQAVRTAVQDQFVKKGKRQQRSVKMRKMSEEAEVNLQRAMDESTFLIPKGDVTPEELIDARLIVVRPDSEHASKFFGNPQEFSCNAALVSGRVKWCVSATHGENVYDAYRRRGTFNYFVINKTKTAEDPYHKYALSYEINPFYESGYLLTVFDAEDNVVSSGDAESTHAPGLGLRITKMCEDHLRQTQPPDGKLRKLETVFGPRRTEIPGAVASLIRGIFDWIRSSGPTEISNGSPEIEAAMKTPGFPGAWVTAP